MQVELRIVAFGTVLLLVHIFAAGNATTKQYGVKWNTGARDEALPPLNPIAGRLSRAQVNFQETFPAAIAALIGVVLAGRASEWTALGGWTWFGARIVYLPLYYFGVPKFRTLAFLLSLAGLALVVWPLLS